MIAVTGSIQIDERDIAERFVRASGPGGQNINKVATAVELRFDVDRSALPDGVKARLRTLARNRLAADGTLVIDSRAFRTQAQNRKAARQRLLALVRAAARAPKRRKPTAAPAAARQKRLESKRLRGSVKASRRRSAVDE
jgi:ribosome-associated protein